MRLLVLFSLLFVGCAKYDVETKNIIAEVAAKSYTGAISGVAPGLTSSGKGSISFYSEPEHWFVVVYNTECDTTTFDDKKFFLSSNVKDKFTFQVKVYTNQETKQKSCKWL
jgi:hypothetical protein